MKPSFPILCGIAGAVAFFFATMFLLSLIDFIPRGDIGAAWIALIISIGSAIAGTLVGSSIGRHFAGPDSVSNLKSLFVVVALAVSGLSAYVIYSYATATPWLKPGGILLRYEVRLPPGSSEETVKGLAVDLVTSNNTMPFSYHREKKFRTSDPIVVMGEVDIAFRDAHRQLDLKIPGQPVRSFTLKLPKSPPHSQFGAWQKHPDGGEIRYRVVWPGQD